MRATRALEEEDRLSFTHVTCYTSGRMSLKFYRISHILISSLIHGNRLKDNSRDFGLDIVSELAEV